MPLDNAEVFRLISACQAARRAFDKDAYDATFRSLYEEHSSTVRGIARHITRSAEDAQEVANWAFAELHRAMLILDPARGCMGLLRTFLNRRAADLYSRRTIESEEGQAADDANEPPDGGPNPEDRLLDIEKAKICCAKAERVAAMVFGRVAGPPNERITYLFCRSLDYKPARLADQKFSQRKLGVSASKEVPALDLELEAQWTERSRLPGTRISDLFAPLRQDLAVKLCDYPLHGSTRNLYSGTQIWTHLISDGQLRQYFRSQPETEDIRKWCLNVQKRMVTWSIQRRKSQIEKGGAQ